MRLARLGILPWRSHKRSKDNRVYLYCRLAWRGLNRLKLSKMWLPSLKLVIGIKIKMWSKRELTTSRISTTAVIFNDGNVDDNLNTDDTLGGATWSSIRYRVDSATIGQLEAHLKER
jgi:hypothetical protein